MPLKQYIADGGWVKLIIAILLFLEFQPYFVWNMAGTTMLLIITLPLILILLLHSQIRNELFTTIIFAFITLTAAIAEGNNLFGCIFKLMVIVLFLCTNYLQDVYKYLKIIYVFIIGLSSIVWLCCICGIPLPSQEIPPLNPIKDYIYTQYPFLVVMGDSIIDSFRFCGVFDEPGVVGTISMLMLIIDNYDLRKLSNIILFISGLISMSLFFYLCSILYFMYYVFTKKGQSKFKVLSIIFLILLSFLTYNIEITHDTIWSRLEYDENTVITGNNRADDELKQYINQIRGSEAYWFGVHDNAVIEKYSNSASIQNAILKYGVIGCLMYALFFVVYVVRRTPNRTDAFFCILFLYVTLWQRPGFYLIPYVFLYLVMIKRFSVGYRTEETTYEENINTY